MRGRQFDAVPDHDDIWTTMTFNGILDDDTEVYVRAGFESSMYHFSRRCAEGNGRMLTERWMLGELKKQFSRAIACHCTLRKLQTHAPYR